MHSIHKRALHVRRVRNKLNACSVDMRWAAGQVRGETGQEKGGERARKFPLGNFPIQRCLEATFLGEIFSSPSKRASRGINIFFLTPPRKSRIIRDWKLRSPGTSVVGTFATFRRELAALYRTSRADGNPFAKLSFTHCTQSLCYFQWAHLNKTDTRNLLGLLFPKTIHEQRLNNSQSNQVSECTIKALGDSFETVCTDV